MTPALRPGDYLIGRRARRLVRGDLVVFEHPQRSGFFLVKRVVGMPGERIEISDGRVLIDDQPEPGNPVDTNPPGRWVLDQEQIFVLSDARAMTRSDSRSFGPIPRHSVIRVVARYWPRRRIRLRFPRSGNHPV